MDNRPTLFPFELHHVLCCDGRHETPSFMQQHQWMVIIAKRKKVTILLHDWMHAPRNWLHGKAYKSDSWKINQKMINAYSSFQFIHEHFPFFHPGTVQPLSSARWDEIINAADHQPRLFLISSKTPFHSNTDFEPTLKEEEKASILFLDLHKSASITGSPWGHARHAPCCTPDSTIG